MQTETLKPLSPSYRAIGRGPSGTIFAACNIAEATRILTAGGFAAYETADGLLSMRPEYAAETAAAIADRDFYADAPCIFPIVAGCVDMVAVVRFIEQ